ncbi:MAG: hypothetical protein ABI809_07095 [Caldimonas sp.]
MQLPESGDVFAPFCQHAVQGFDARSEDSRNPLTSEFDAMKQVEYFRWTYRDTWTREVCRTAVVMTVDEAAARYPGATRIKGTVVVREVEDDAEETLPELDFQRRPGLR